MLCDLSVLWTGLCELIDAGVITLLQAVSFIAQWCSTVVG